MKFIILCSWLKFLIKVLHFNFLSIKKTKKKKLSIIKSPKNYFPLLKYLIKTNSFNRYHSPSILTVKRSIKLVVTLFSHSFKLVVTLLSHSPACQICNNIQHILNVFFFLHIIEIEQEFFLHQPFRCMYCLPPIGWKRLHEWGRRKGQLIIKNESC